MNLDRGQFKLGCYQIPAWQRRLSVKRGAWLAECSDRGAAMTGADRLCDVLLVNGIDVCFANPGTSEMHFVAALDRKPQMRCVLGLFEGVATGAADGYARMTGKPAATLLHTGPGLANGLANLHNAKRARVPMVNIVGDHASYHVKYDAPLTSDVEALAWPMSDWVRKAAGPADVGPAAEAAIMAARTMPGIATLILPADSAWGDVAGPAPAALAIPAPPQQPGERLHEIALAMGKHAGRVGIIVGGEAAYGAGLAAAGRVAAACDGLLLTEVLPGRVEHGRGKAQATRIPYPIDAALRTLAGLDLLILCGAPEPVAFFAYPDKPSRLLPDGCAVMTLADRAEDKLAALQALADELGAPSRLPIRPPQVLEPLPTGALTEDAIAVIVAARLPEGAILAEEALTSARRLFALAADAAPHDYLMTTGGAIGIGLPLALGAAIACPDRKVVNVQADGSGMYTLQALWSMAREQADVLVIVCANRRYAILQTEMRNLGFNQIGDNATRMLSLDQPALDWVKLAEGMGVEAARAESCERLDDLARAALSRRGPFLIEAVI